MERFHALAKSGTLNPGRAGWVGQITSNSFMAREFGVPLIEKFLPTVDLVEVIDTSGAYIPGHGTPTVTLVSRSRRPQADTIRAVLGIQGEPGAPVDPAQGLVWSSIVTHVDDAGYEDRWISVTDLPRAELGTHPWSLQGGAAGKVSGQIDTSSRCSLSEFVSRIGFYGQTNADSAFLTDQATVARFRLEADFTKQLVVGDE